MANFELLCGRSYYDMTPEARSFFDVQLAGKRAYNRSRLLSNTVEKNCRRCGKWFLAGGDYSPATRKWRKNARAQYCSKFCSARSYGPNRYRLDPSQAPTEHPSAIDIAWAAGVYEGEGSIVASDVKHCVTVTVPQKDRWILDRLTSLFGGKVVRIEPQRGRFSDDFIHRWALGGARARGFIYTIFTFLSPRRRKQVVTALDINVINRMGAAHG